MMAAKFSVRYLVVGSDLDLRLFRTSRFMEPFCSPLGFLVESSVPGLALIWPAAARSSRLSICFAKFAVSRRAPRPAAVAV